MDNEKNSCCFSKILRLIEGLQKKSSFCENIDNTCMKPFLGTNINPLLLNTRPVTFYGCDGNLITINYTMINNGVTVEGTSSVFRVEEVNDDSVIVSLLIDNPTPSETEPYITTNNTAIINLNCVCALKCLNDTIVNL